MSRILIVDDKEMMRDSVATMLSRKGHGVTVSSGARAALDKIAARPFDAVITDLQMPEMDGLELLAEIRRHDEQLPVVFMTAFGTVETAVAAMKRGAFDYLTKPFSGDALLVAVDRALEHGRLVRENQILRAAVDNGAARRGPGPHEMIGTGSTMRRLKNRLSRIADSHGTVLINGESGTGKEVAARSSSATRKARSPAPTGSARAASSWPTGGRSCSTRSAKSHRPSRPSCFAYSRSGASSASAAATVAPWTCGSSPPRTATCRRRSPAARFARTSTSVSTSCP